LHYRSWPDFGVPSSSLGLRELLHLVKFYSDNGRSKGIEGPVIVHCSAGIGRTGAFLAAYAIIEGQLFQSLVHNPEFISFAQRNPFSPGGYNRMMTEDSEEQRSVWFSMLSQFKVPEVVLELRRQRNRGMVQTDQQYAFIYQVIVDEILSTSEDQKISPNVKDIMQQELHSKLQLQLRENEERSATESEDDYSNRDYYDDDVVNLKSSSPSSGCLRRSPAQRNHRWSPLAVSPLIKSPSRSPQQLHNNRAFLTSSAPSAHPPLSDSPLSPDDLPVSRLSNSSTTGTPRPRPRRKELYSDSLELDLPVECYSPKRGYLAQTVQF